VEALLGLAVSFERYAEYQAAREHLERLLEARPGDEEGRLRLAVNLARLGEKGKSARQLEELAGAAEASWVRALAAEERARPLLRAEKWEEAGAWLEQALGRSPGADKLYLQAALVEVARGEPWRAHETLDRLASRRASEPSVEPRFRYASWPVERLSAPRARVEESLAASREALAQALAELPREQPR
jgi:DNA-binding SARP family transcriptional activator